MSERVLRYRMTAPYVASQDPWVTVHRDGRVERAVPSHLTNSVFQPRGTVTADLAERARRLAVQVTALPRPELSDAAHDPTQLLELEVVHEGATHRTRFLWGRASRNDAPLEPVSGDGAIEAFNELHAVLTANLYGWKEPPARGA
jgi:hypothetical protein